MLLTDLFQNIKGKHVTILGAGKSGIAAAKLLQSKGAQVFISDSMDQDQKTGKATILEEAQIPFEFGRHSSVVFDADFWVISPGIPMSSSIVKQGEEKNILILSELELAYHFCKSPIIAVTGSNGKSTTTALLGAMFQESGISCQVAGNIGFSFSYAVEATVPEGVVVLEVSSFQLETIHDFHPKGSIFLNLTPDHLDRHSDMKNYGQIKSLIFKNQNKDDFLIYNGDDEIVQRIAKSAACQKLIFAQEPNLSHHGYVKNQMLTIRLQNNEERVLSVQEMSLKGEHNIGNALAAALAARMMDVDLEAIQKTLKTFKGLPHRLEFVRSIGQVDWYNDSKATNMDSVRYALGSFKNPIILIAGGRDKDSDFDLLRQYVQDHVLSMILIGEASRKIENALKDVTLIQKADTLKEAVLKSHHYSKAGDTVLLSPGCASFDMFENFEDRGNQFKNLVREL